ncbi:hypothetical protein N7520_008777 [Penicillium odoratum]|uniref:uncharacterized protein n=1 Tax=Penicillium odoratum TaxID=1167516 RepID=UPI002546B8C7|nr:uncharacterized protein N7520_008777 [Penicillium odoratum]KAJ5751860.1 hypothetical protein N7520_008777 [Penicillium odoratum]
MFFHSRVVHALLVFFFIAAVRFLPFIRKFLRGPPQIEADHPKSENFNDLQQFRFKRFYDMRWRQFRDISNDFLRIEHALRAAAQHENPLNKETVQNSSSRWTRSEGNQYHLFEEELRDSKQDYWMRERAWWAHRAAFAGFMAKAFDLWRSYPKWYMHEILVEDCVAQGGCCGRKYGCCSKRRLDVTPRLEVGHCTANCQCCIREQGFVFTSGMKRKLNEYSRLRTEFGRPKVDNVTRASIWGWMESSKVSPFDLIVEPRGYEKPALLWKNR